MRIIYITAGLPYATGEAFIIEEVRELIGLGHEVLVVPRSPGRKVLHAAWLVNFAERETLLSPRVLRDAFTSSLREPQRTLRAAREALQNTRVRLTVKNLAVLPKALWLARLATRWGASHIHCHWAGTTATMAMIASRLTGIPWSLTAHRWDIVENNALSGKAESAEFVRVISEGGRHMMAAQGVGHDSKIRVLRMGVRLPKAAVWTPPANPVVLCPANLVDVKGHRFLLRAWRILKDRGVHAELWLAGGGELANSLKALSEELGISASVKFLGPVRHEALLDLYDRARISAVALASVDLGDGCHEGIPVALVEAMGYGVPVISTTTGSIPELITNEAGVLVPPQDPAALAAALETVLLDRVTARRLGRGGRRRVEEVHDVRTVVSELEQLFLSSSGSSSAESLVLSGNVQ